MTARNLRNIYKNHNCKARYDRLTRRAYYSGGYTGTGGDVVGIVNPGCYWTYDVTEEEAVNSMERFIRLVKERRTDVQ